MKAISLWQPWAAAMAAGLKRNETRSRCTHYRGDLVICSAKIRTPLDCFGVEKWPRYSPRIGIILYGYALCVVEVYDCVPTYLANQDLTMVERELGDYRSGRYAWRTRNLRALKNPVPVVGRQFLWNLPDDVSARIREQL